MNKITKIGIGIAATLLVACTAEQNEFGRGKDGCFQFSAKIESEISTPRSTRSEGEQDTLSHAATISFGSDTVFVEPDVYLTADVDLQGKNTVSTRGVPMTSTAQIPSLKVHVFKTGASTWASGSNRVLEHELRVTNATGGNFDYGSPVDFPTDGVNRTFIAYCPLEGGTSGIAKSADTKLTYTVQADVTKHPDLCTSVLRDNTDIKQPVGGNEHVRDFTLQHELTAIGFALRGSGVSIKSATITGVYTTGSFDLGTKAWATSGNTSASLAAGIVQQTYNVGINESWVNCTQPNGYLMMIPQTLTDAAKLTIVYQYNYGENKGKDLALTSNLKKLTGGVWRASQRVTYNIRLKADPVVTANDQYIDCSVAGYTTQNPINVGSVATDDVLTFTWDASWLKVHQGSPKENNASGGAASGWSVTTNKAINNIYFFATNNNPSTMTRTATVTVRGKKSLERTFKVTQKAQPTLEVNMDFFQITNYQYNECYIDLTTTNLSDISISDIYWLKSSFENGRLKLRVSWNLAPYRREEYLTLTLREKGTTIKQERILIRQFMNEHNSWLIINELGTFPDVWSRRVIRALLNITDQGKYAIGTQDIKRCGSGRTLPNERQWSEIISYYSLGTFAGYGYNTPLWINKGNLNSSSYWTNKWNSGGWADLGYALLIDWGKRDYTFAYLKESQIHEYRCIRYLY